MARRVVKPGQVCPECMARVKERHVPVRDCDYHSCVICGPIVADASKVDCRHTNAEQARHLADVHRRKGLVESAATWDRVAEAFKRRDAPPPPPPRPMVLPEF